MILCFSILHASEVAKDLKGLQAFDIYHTAPWANQTEVLRKEVCKNRGTKGFISETKYPYNPAEDIRGTVNGEMQDIQRNQKKTVTMHIELTTTYYQLLLLFLKLLPRHYWLVRVYIFCIK